MSQAEKAKPEVAKKPASAAAKPRPEALPANWTEERTAEGQVRRTTYGTNLIKFISWLLGLLGY